MEEQKKQDDLERYFVPLHLFEKEKSQIYKDIEKKTNKNRDKIEEVDDKHTENFYQLQRNLDQYMGTMNNLNESVKSLNESFITMSDTLSNNINDLKTVTDRVSRTEETITEQDINKKERFKSAVKILGIVITSILGSGGLLSWLGPLLFGK